MAAIVAALRAGLPYLPVDPRLPHTLLVSVMRRCAVRAVVAEPALIDRARAVAATAGLTVVVADVRDLSATLDSPTVREASQLAYVILTSGSTGHPKAVAVPASALENYCDAAIEMLGGTALCDARLATVTTLAADLGLTMVLPALLAGAELHVVPERVAQDPRAYVAYQREHALDAVKLVPTHLRALLDATRGSEVLPLRTLIVGGEGFAVDLAKDLRRRDASCRVLNHYGPTETCVGVAMGVVDLARDTAQAQAAGLPTVPVGRPISGVRLTVVDHRLAPVAPGTAGELLIEGAAVAWGYVGQSQETAARFVPAADGARAFLSGDRACLQPDGRIVILDRVDRQLKIRGNRVEPAGIEAMLREQPGVIDAYVGVREIAHLGPTVIAWVVGPVDPAVIRNQVHESLPPEQVPARVVVVDRLPRTSNGKVDAKALSLEADEPVVVAGGTEEAMLGVVFAEVLGVSHVEPDTDVLALGLHSLAAVQAIARLEARTGRTLTVGDVFALRTPAAMARAVKKAEAPEGAPLGGRTVSPQQLALWTLARRDPADTTYVIPLVLAVLGEGDPAAVRRALIVLIARHDVLRTTYPDVDGVPVPRLHDVEDAFELDVVDASRDVHGKEVERRLMNALAGEPLDVLDGPLLRATFLRLGDTSGTLLLAVHHVVFDGGSIAVLVRELAEVLDRGELADQRPAQYADDPSVPARAGHGSAPAPGQLGLAERGSGTPRRSSALRRRPLSAVTRAGVAAAASAAGVTEYMALLAAWAIVLARQSDEDVVTVLAPADLRPRPAFEGAVGHFVNAVPVGVRVDPGAQIGDLLGSVRQGVTAAIDQRKVPYAEHARRARLEHGASEAARTMLTLTKPANATSGRIAVRQESPPIARAMFDLDLEVIDRPELAEMRLHFDEAVCGMDRAASLLDQFSAALEAIAADRSVYVRDVELVTADARDALRRLEDSGPEAAFEPVHERLIARLVEGPRVRSVVTGQHWTGTDLDEISRHIAARLAVSGIGRGSLVGVSLAPSAWLVAAWLGVLRSGAGVLALDPAWPAGRRRAACSAGRPRAVIALGPEGWDLPVLTPERLVEVPADRESAPHVEPWDVAYAVLTSGSTGDPRLVAVTHAGLAAHLAFMELRHPLASTDCILLHTSPGFDVAAWEAIGALAQGASLAVAEQPRNVEHLAETIAAAQVTGFQTVPSLLKVLLEEPASADWRSVRTVWCGGEVMPLELPAAVGARLPGAKLVNMYGPSETAIDAAWHEPDGRGGPVPLGRPIDGVRVHVIDPNLRRVPVGVWGDLAITGPTVALGYMGDARATAARFVPDPHVATPGARMYLTGDRVRWGEAGVLEFGGRRDHQVKLRGQRIELQEIEAVLSEMFGVREAAVALDETGATPRLVAYLAADRGALSEEALRTAAERRLTEAMVPSVFLRVCALPRLLSGKVDRRALATTHGEVIARSGPAPRTELEREVAAVWMSLLGDRVEAVDRSFRDAGGSSLLVPRLRVHLCARFGVELSVAELFEHVTVRGQAARIEALQGTTGRGNFDELLARDRHRGRRAGYERIRHRSDRG